MGFDRCEDSRLATKSCTFSGHEAELDKLLKRNRGSVQALLELTESPDLGTDPKKLEEISAMRSVPMVSERLVVWAIQTGDDISSRQPLPEWISLHIGRNQKGLNLGP